ncbi:DEAD-box ATP-dependent RNA helicase 31 [Sarracenia purpurea var. burkii]
MPVKLLPHLRLLNPSLPVFRFATMNPNPTVKNSSYRVIAIFSCVFPHKIKYQSRSRNVEFLKLPIQHHTQRQYVGARRFSTRSVRHRPSSSAEVRASKSLIDDEAELSDWVSELRSDSFLTRLNIDNDEEFDNGRGSIRGRGSDRSIKRGRDGDSDECLTPNRQMGRDLFGSFSRNSMGKPRFGSELQGKDDGFVARRRENNWGGEKKSIISKTGGQTSEFGYGRDHNGGGGLKRQRDGKGLRRGGSVTAEDEIVDNDEEEEEEEERLMKTFRDLMSEEDSEDDDDDDGDRNMLKNAAPLFAAKQETTLQDVPCSPRRSDSYLSETRFDQCSVSPSSLKGIKDAGYEMMTVVQEATLPLILEGKDVLAKAKTGTGKTVAFLVSGIFSSFPVNFVTFQLPSIEVVVKSPPVSRDQKRPPILVLVICPTRELASQAAAEANTLLKYHPSVGVEVVIGGTRLPLEQKRMQANPCQILVATPGRLRDHIENTAGFATRLKGVKVLVLDEADHLLDMGFRKNIEKIIAAVPKQRQTLLFSATVPDEVRQICYAALKRDHEFIDTVGEGSEQTHSQVRQMHLVASLDKHFSLLYVLLKEHISDDADYKVLVFCTTAMVTRLVADLLGELNLNVREIHSRKPQSHRTRISDEFRKSKGLILVTSDVSARGVDYPDVTLVLQVGLPADREQYIHRLGRTGRKGKEGQGILLLTPWEEFFLSSIKDLPITKSPQPSIDPETRKKVERALSHVERKNKEAAYQAWLGYYNSNKMVGRDKYKLVELANEFSRSTGLDNPPPIPKFVLSKMGLRNIPGLRSK